MSHSLGVYMTATFIAPLVALCVSSLGLFITVYAILVMCWPFHPRVEQCIKSRMPSYMVCEARARPGRVPCWTFIFGGLKLIYGHQLAETRKTDGSVSYFICERKIKPWLMAMLFMVVIFVCSCTAVAFWGEFLVKESFICEPGLDCFPFNQHGKAMSHEPINCSDYENSNIIICCYQFVFSYGSALGNAGGVLVLASVVMNIQAGLWIGASSQRRKWGFCCAMGWVIFLNVVIEILLLATPFVASYVPLVKSTVMSTNGATVQFYAYWITFLCAFTFSGPLMIIFSRASRKFKAESTLQGVTHPADRSQDIYDDWTPINACEKHPVYADV